MRSKTFVSCACVRSSIEEKQLSINTSHRDDRSTMKQYSKYSAKKSDQDLFLPFARNLDQAECKSGSESTRSSMESSLSPAPSPSPCTMLSDMNFQDDAPIKYKQYTQDIAQRVKTYQCPSTRKSRKRKLNADGTTNCLKRVTLSDGSVCYTMAPQPSTNSTPRHDSNPIRYPMSEPPKKKRRDFRIFGVRSFASSIFVDNSQWFFFF